MMNKARLLKLIILLWCIVSGVFGGLVINAQNINVALHKPYAFSVTPNYRTPDINTLSMSLTDGVLEYESDKSFWTQKTTAGWAYKDWVAITIDLQGNYAVNEVCFNTVKREKSQIPFPRNILVYVSKDNKDFVFFGDMRDDNNNGEHPYEVKQFSIEIKNPLEARYVKIIVVPYKRYIFTNEIEVYGIPISTNRFKVANTTVATKEIDSKLSNILIERKKEWTLEDDILRLNKITKGKVSATVKSSNELQQQFSKYLSTSFEEPFTAVEANPWDKFYELEVPVKSVSRLNENTIVPLGMSNYGAIKLTNTSQSDKKLKINASKNGSIGIYLFKGLFVRGIKRNDVLDALKPISLEAQISLDPGMSTIVIYKLIGKEVGEGKLTIEITSDDGYLVKIPIKFKTIKLNYKKDGLNAVNWAYFNKPLLKGKKNTVIEDLEQHHINTYVAPTNVLGWLNSTNITEMKQYFSGIDTTSNLTLYYNIGNKKIRTVKGTVPFMSEQWKQLFKRWYTQRFEALVEMGFSPNKIYFYPFDEPDGDKIKMFINFSKWVKKEISNLQLFTTILQPEALKISEYTDIAVVSDRLNIKEIRDKLPKNTWMYSILSMSRSRSPYSDYRLMAWKAFYYNLKGIGFWNYASFLEREENKASSLYLNGNKDYSVIYTNKENITTSRRWEAFSKGIEDYKILNFYARKYGYNKTKKMVEKVLKSDLNVELADLTIQKMLQSFLSLK